MLFIISLLMYVIYNRLFVLLNICKLFYLITGGLTAVIYTDTLQAVLMVGGAVTLMAMGRSRLYGWGII